MKQIPLTQGKFALVDDEDFERLSAYKWCAAKSFNTFYAVRKGSRSKFSRENIIMHRVILGVSENVIVDHIDRNGLNNIRENLRICTQAENMRNNNLYKNNVTGFKGVSVDMETGKFRAKIYINNKGVFLGRFSAPEEAARAYDKAALKYFGEFASLNFPENPVE